MNRTLIRRLPLPAFVVLLAIGYATVAAATDIKTLGRLKIPPDASILSVCTDPVVQSVLGEDLRQKNRTGTPVILTVTVNSHPLAPGTSLQDLSPGDPSVAEMLRDMGAEPPALGDTGDKPLEDQYTMQARRQILGHEDVGTTAMRGYIGNREDAGGQSPYDKIPADQMYQTAIIARASASDASTEFKVVALVEPGGDIRTAKKLVAEAIADAVLH
jgi:hypothetical protein